MPHELWLQCNSENKQKFKKWNKPIVDFLKVNIADIVTILEEKIEFKIVDISSAADIKEAQSRGVEEFPMLSTPKKKIIGPPKILDYFRGLRNPKKARARRMTPRSEFDLDEDEDEQAIRRSMESELLNNSDDEDEGDGSASARVQRAADMTARRKAMYERKSGGGYSRGRRGGDRHMKKSKSKEPPPSDTEEESEDDAPKHKKKSKQKKKARGRVEVSPVDITIGLEGDGDQRQDDALMTQFWENQSSTK